MAPDQATYVTLDFEKGVPDVYKRQIKAPLSGTYYLRLSEVAYGTTHKQLQRKCKMCIRDRAEAASEEWLPLTLMTGTSPHVQRRGPFCGDGRLWHVRIGMDTKRDIKITAGECSHP